MHTTAPKKSSESKGRRNMKKNGLCLLLALALMLGLFAGCSNNQQGDEPSAPPAKTDEPATPPADNEPADPAAGEVN